MIQNLKIKVEPQINNLEKRTETMQEIKKSQHIMNNVINESKTLWRQQTVE